MSHASELAHANWTHPFPSLWFTGAARPPNHHQRPSECLHRLGHRHQVVSVAPYHRPTAWVSPCRRHLIRRVAAAPMVLTPPPPHTSSTASAPRRSGQLGRWPRPEAGSRATVRPSTVRPEFKILFSFIILEIHIKLKNVWKIQYQSKNTKQISIESLRGDLGREIDLTPICSIICCTKLHEVKP
jgi:hypothetical protein